jgi:hypothetical protein
MKGGHMLTSIATPVPFAEESENSTPISCFFDKEFAGLPSIVALLNRPLAIELSPHPLNYVWLLSVLQLNPGDPGIKSMAGPPSWFVDRCHLKTLARAMAEEFGYVNVFVETGTEAVSLTLLRGGDIIT